MGFFDKVKSTASVVANKAKETGTAIGDASKTAIEKQKVKNAINKENMNITKQYTEIGKKYYELFGNQASLEFAENIKNINNSKDEIYKLTIQLNALDDYVTCSCGAKVPKNAGFCPTCGNAIAISDTTIEEHSNESVIQTEEETTPMDTPEVVIENDNQDSQQ